MNLYAFQTLSFLVDNYLHFFEHAAADVEGASFLVIGHQRILIYDSILKVRKTFLLDFFLDAITFFYASFPDFVSR